MSNVLKIVQILQTELNKISGLEDAAIEIPSKAEFGDLSTNIAMIRAKDLKKQPIDLAQEWVKKLLRIDFVNNTFSQVQAIKPGFINFFYNQKFIASEFNDFIAKGKYGASAMGKGKRFIIEYSSPNTNKPLHVGHLRNNALGMALANLLEFLGFEIIKTEVINDRGIHIMKSMLAYQLFGQDKTPESENIKSDKFVGDYYVLYSKLEKADPSLKAKAQNLLVRWEQGEEEVRKLWKKMNKWTYQGWDKTYKIYNSKFDSKEYESELYNQGKEIVYEALQAGVLEKNSEGAVVIDLSKYGLGGKDSGQKILVRPDKTTVYITQDIYLAKKRYDKYKFAKMIYVVGDEQIYHFKVLFKILEILGYDWHKKLVHYPYAHVLLPEGKMKSREGKVVDADDLLEDLYNLAGREIIKREQNIAKADLEKRAWAIALAAVKYWFLKSNQKSKLLFNPQESLAFEGNTGPYLLYTYARLNKILKKSKVKIKDKIIADNLRSDEENIIRKILQWPLLLEKFSENYNVNLVTEYAYQLATLLNNFYQQVPVLKSDNYLKNLRLTLLDRAGEHLNLVLRLLNIKTIKKM